MKLLILTQAVDMEHPILGFFHRWIEEFAKHCELVSVICLQEGRHQLPPNVRVYSLGKESGENRLKYVWNFYRLIFALRKDYDRVFVHMNQVYVLLGGLYWRLAQKPIALWYAHGKVSSSLRIAALLSNVVFTSTTEGFRIKTIKKKIVGQGIDTNAFISKPRHLSDTTKLITVGRISQSKNIETLIRACSILKKANFKFSFKIIGAPITEIDKEYSKQLELLVLEHDLASYIQWTGAVPNKNVSGLLQDSDVFIQDSTTDSLDKALLEAVLCGCFVITSNKAYSILTSNIAPEFLFEKGDHLRLAQIIMEKKNNIKFENLHKFLIENSISNLISKIISKY